MRRTFAITLLIVAGVTVVIRGGQIAPPQSATYVNSVGMRMVRIPAGSFTMGETAGPIPEDLIRPLHYQTPQSLQKRFPNGDPAKLRVSMGHVEHGDFDEKPARTVKITKPFYLGAHEITNAEYEAFDPAHRRLRGQKGFSKADDEAVLFVSWNDARNFCEWLSKKEGLPYRLPTEAEWEYACRAGTRTLYSTGNTLPKEFQKNARSTDFEEPADLTSLTVGRTPANPWGLFDMHGNVEEWCHDWYGPYDSNDRVDPVGRADGDSRVTRGGSHGTPLYYLRSANRMGAPPETRNWLIGFRVAMGEMPSTKALPPTAPERYQRDVSQRPAKEAPAPAKPYFEGPRQFVRIPENSDGPLYSHHNHDTAIAECPNGDLLAIWYTCVQERGRELAVAASRLRRGKNEWEAASPFWDVPDRNDHCPGLWFDGKQTLYHFNGLGIASRWAPLAIVMRTSRDNGVTWSKASFVTPEFGFRNMVGEPALRTRDGSILFGADIAKRSIGEDKPSSNIWVSPDEGRTWSNPGGVIPGIHAAIAQLNDGRLMALGRGVNIDGWMPMSFSSDMGRTWNSVASPFPPIAGGQRAALLRLREGALLFISYAMDIRHFDPSPKESERYYSSLFAAVSFDEGKTWPARRVISPGGPERGALTIDGGRIRMSAMRSEPLGYCSATQSRDGLIHVLTSINHYAFNLAWVKRGQPEGTLDPVEIRLPRRVKLARDVGSAAHWTNERTGGADTIDAAQGFTVEVRARPGDGTFEIEAYAASGSLLLNRYRIRIASGAISMWRRDAWHEVVRLSDGAHTLRLAVREDTAIQIWLDGAPAATLAAEVVSDRSQATRGSYIEWKAGGAAAVERFSYDFAGAFAP